MAWSRQSLARRHAVRLAVLVGAAVLFAGSALAAATVSASYECLWWSAAQQMANFNPDHPPPKLTPTPIARWEYSDPVAPPHPDVVTLVVRVDAADAARLTVQTRWLGTIWSPPIRRKMTAPMATEGAVRVLRFEIPVVAYINAHGPKRLRSTSYLAGVKVKDIDLPIVMGD